MARAAPTPTILVVDDEDEIRSLLKAEFTLNDCIVFEAANAKEAIQVLIERHVDAILSDVRMPGGDGLELLAYIRQNVRPLPFFFMTGFSGLADEAHGVEAAFFIRKPFRLDSVVENVITCVRGAELDRHQEAP